MKVTFGVLTLGLGLAALVTVPAAIAQNSYYYAGQAESGQPLMVDLDSIASVSEHDANFNYVVGEELVQSQAHCVGGGAWTTLNDGVVHYAQSQATREMVRIVCSYSNQASEIASASSLPPAPADPLPPVQVEPLPPAPLESAPIDIVVEPAPIESAPIDIAVEPAPSISRPASRSAASGPSPSRSAATQTALVYDPSSNVRATPNGQILCSIDTRAYINIYGQWGDWYDTDACGSLGVIHISQIQF